MSECEYASTDIPARYLQEKLDGAEAESFEAHYFACERCWSELEIGMAIRPPKPARATSRRRPLRVPLAIAAGLVLVTISALMFIDRPVPDQAPVYRGGAANTISITTGVEGKRRVLRWNTIPNASAYTVILFDSDGTELQRSATRATVFTLERGGRVFARVEAIDSDGETIATSSLQPVDATK